MPKKNFQNALLIIILFIVSGCGVLDAPIQAYKTAKNYVFPPGEKLYWKSLDILVRKDANMNYPIAIDIVLLKNEALLNKVLELDSKSWFGQKESVLKIFRKDIEIKSLELAPGDLIKVPKSFFQNQRVFGVIVFANYINDGDYRERIDDLEGVVVIDFDIDNFDAYEIKPN